jgi:hypothetical protein
MEADMGSFLNRVGEGAGLAAVMTSILMWSSLAEPFLR